MQPQRKVVGYHLILTCYGFWLPNDPRGSGSSAVWSEALRPFGPATKVTTDRSVAGRSHDVQLRRDAKRALKRQPIRFHGRQAQCVARAFGEYIGKYGITCLACATMPDHAHLVLARSSISIERIAIGLKAASVHSLLVAGLHPHQNDAENVRPKLWARGARHPFLFDQRDINRAIQYVNNNPIQWGFKPQRWSFVTR